MEKEKWKPTPEGYAELIISMVGLMQKEEAWERMLSRLYACANELFCTNGHRSPYFNNREAVRAFMEECRAATRAQMEAVTV